MGKPEIDYERKIPSKLEQLDQGLELVNFDGFLAGVSLPDPHKIIIPVGSSEHWIYLIKEYSEKVVS